MVRVDVGGSVRAVDAQVVPRLQFSTVCDLDGFQRSIVTISLHCLDICDNSEALGDLAKHHVLVIKVRTVDCGYEELRPVRVGARVGHGEDSAGFVFQVILDLVDERGAPDAVATLARAGRITWKC